MHVTRSTHLVLHVTIILIAFGEHYKIWSFFLWTFLYPPVASSFVGLDILSGILSILNFWYRITQCITGRFLYVISYMRDCTKCRKRMSIYMFHIPNPLTFAVGGIH
jgi:hypothetical protein